LVSKLKTSLAMALAAVCMITAATVALHRSTAGSPVPWIARPLQDNDAVSGQGDTLVLVVTASYPGANAQVVADTVAAPIEELVIGVEGLVRIKSTSDNNGQYTAHLYFKAKTDPEAAMKLVNGRIWQAEPVVPDLVLKEKVAVKVGKAEARPSEVAFAIMDRRDNGWEALRKVASAVVKRLEAEGALTRPQVFPGNEKQLFIDIDHAKCESLGVTPDEVFKAIEGASPLGPSPSARVCRCSVYPKPFSWQARPASSKASRRWSCAARSVSGMLPSSRRSTAQPRSTASVSL
jgi:hypothetical protein